MPLCFVVLALLPLLGSLITEPAAMTLAALIVSERLFARGASARLKYLTLGVLGGQQQWWLQPLLSRMNSDSVFLGAATLTAVTDNAALTYLGSLATGLSAEFKYALVAGAVVGGGLTVIANAPNLTGVAIVRRHFDEATVRPMQLLLAALPPTLIAGLALRYL